MDNLKKEFGLKQLKIPISVEYSLDKEVEILPVSFLSLDGLFAETTLSYPVGSNVVIRFYLPDKDRVVEAVGEIIAIVKDGTEEGEHWDLPGIVIKFKAMESEDKRSLELFLKKNSL